MPNFWNQQGVPRKGWILIDVIDVREEDQSEDETEYESCQMCGNEKIRFVHILSHVEVVEDVRVGCICAEKMTSDYVNPKKREKELRNRASRRTSWVKKEWKISKHNNYFLKIEGHLLIIFKNKINNKYKVKIDEKYGQKAFQDLKEAKVAAFNGVEYLKRKGLW